MIDFQLRACTLVCLASSGFSACVCSLAGSHEFWASIYADNDVWSLAILPIGRKFVTTKRVFRPIHDINGKIFKYKARLVARGFGQIYGHDFDETYSPVTRLSSLKLLFALSMQFNLDLQQMDQYLHLVVFRCILLLWVWN